MSRILLVEDDETLSEMYFLKFDHDGHDIDRAIDGQIALDQLKRIEYDLILLDLMLPKVNGFVVLESLRNSNWPSQTKPVVIMSNLGQYTDIEKGKKLGANEYFIKSEFLPNEIMERIKKYMK
jgi:DNA-binding response OmpR family regulator